MPNIWFVLSLLPHWPQNRPAASGAAASGVPQCWQYFPPPVSLSHDGQRAVTGWP